MHEKKNRVEGGSRGRTSRRTGEQLDTVPAIMNHLLSSLSDFLFSQAWFNSFEFLVVTLARGFLLHVSSKLEMGRLS